MSDKKQAVEAWSYEKEREERKKRLDELKTRDGKKKPIRQKMKLSSLLLIVVVLALIGGVFFLKAYMGGLKEKKTAALTINGDSIMANEVNFYTSIFAPMVDQSLQEGAFTDKSRQTLAQEVPFGDQPQTVRDMLIGYAMDQLKNDYVSLKAADAENFVASSEGDELVDKILEQLNLFSAQSGVSVKDILAQRYGPGNDKDELRRLIKNYSRAEEYRNHKAEQLVPTDEEMEAIYKENPDNYDEVTFRVMSFPHNLEEYTGPAPEAAKDDADDEKDENEDEEAAADETEAGPQIAQEELAKNALERAEKMKEKVTNEKLFLKEQERFCPKALLEQIQKNPDATRTTAQKAGLPEEMGTFLFAKDRQAGDTSVIHNEQGTWFVLFLSRGRNENQSFTTRHILFMVDPNASEEDEQKVKAEAERVMKEFKEGDATEERFAELANQYSQDPGNQGTRGGLYEKIAPGTFMPEYEAFATAAGRQEGDVELVKTDAGYHIIYFIERGKIIWKEQIGNEVKMERVREWMEAEVAKLEVVEKDKGMDLVLPID